MTATKPRAGHGRLLTAVALLTATFALLQACGDDPTTVSKGSGGDDAGGSANEAGSPATGASSAQGGAGNAPGVGGAGGTDPGSAGEDSGSAGSAGEGNLPGLAFEDFCADMRYRARQWLRECRSFGDAIGWWGTQNIEQVCTSGRDAVEAGRLVYDPIAAEACAAASVGDCLAIEAFAFGVRDGFVQGSACAGVLTGAVELDGECHGESTSYTSECGDGFCTRDACPGTCVAFSDDGEDCDGINTACDVATSFCNSDQKCQAYVARGETCSAALPCVPGDRCAIPVDASTGTCVEVVALGETCDAALGQCETGSVCYEEECVDTVPMNAPCNSTAQCPASSTCTGVCEPAIAEGDDCTPGVGWCVTGTTCEEGKCRLLGQLDQPCPCEVGLWCNADNTCKLPGDVGDDCEQATGAGALSTCLVPLFCSPTTNECSMPAAAGETCSFAYPLDSCQAGLHCVCSSGCGTPISAVATCEPQLELEADCSLARECLSNVCTEGKCAEPAACL